MRLRRSVLLLISGLAFANAGLMASPVAAEEDAATDGDAGAEEVEAAAEELEDAEVQEIDPQMFDDDDPFLERVRQLCAELPATAEKVSHGRSAFFTKKVFVYYGGALKVDGEWVQRPQSVMVQPDAGDR